MEGLSEKKFISDHVIPTLKDAIEQHSEGHVLVFLPGQVEIEQALKAFANSISDDYPHFISLPLFGSLPPEEQDKIMTFDSHKEEGQRMVVFTTNVAETSLTIPGVKLVIDSGLAKEARFDQVRRLQVVELVRISRSSADQRKGRAGRISEGHCIRLFKDEDLVRQNIEPEILRSSLDSVVLQLVRLSYNPNFFPFMTRPAEEALENSIQLLCSVGCIARYPHRPTKSEFETTAKGIIFSDLPFDPRLSAFVIACHEDYNKLELAAIIASILSAPGNLHFMGGASKEDKEEAKRAVALKASQHESDLLYLANEYIEWTSAGATDSSDCCITCQRKVPRNKGCRSCRVKHSMRERLNNKVLEFVQSSAQSVSDVVKKAHVLPSQQGAACSTLDVDAVAACLQRFFPEQFGQVLVPEYPQEGVHLVNVNVRARITNTSSFLNKLRTVPATAFIAMSTTQLPSGEYVVDKLHPIPVTSSLAVPACVCVFQNAGIGNVIYKSLRAWVCQQQQLGREEYKWSVPVYDQQIFSLFNLPSFAEKCQNELNQLVKDLVDKEVDFSAVEIVANGSSEASFSGGMQLTKVEPVRDAFRMSFQNLPFDEPSDFKKWLLDTGILSSDIKWMKAYAPDETASAVDSMGWTGTVVLKSKIAVDAVLEKRQEFVRLFKSEDTDDTSSSSTSSSSSSANTVTPQEGKEVKSSIKAESFQDFNKDAMIRTLTITCHAVKTAVELKEALSTFNVTGIKILQTSAPVFKAVVRDLPKDARIKFNKQWFQTILESRLGPQANAESSGLKDVKEMEVKVPGKSTCEVLLFFDSAEKRNIAVQCFQFHFSHAGIATVVTFNNKKGQVCQKTVSPQVVVDTTKDLIGKVIARLHFPSLSDAELCYNLSLNAVLVGGLNAILGAKTTVEGQGQVKVKHAHLFRDLDSMLSILANSHSISIQRKPETAKKDKKGEGRRFKNHVNTECIEFSKGSPTNISRAIAALEAMTASISLTWSTDKQRAFNNELAKSRKFKSWCDELNLHVEWGEHGRGEVFGNRINQGVLMTRIGDQFDDFEERYIVIPLISAVNNLFSRGKAGEAKFKELSSVWKSKGCTAHHKYMNSQVTAYFAEGTTRRGIQAFEEEFNTMVKSLGGNSRQRDLKCAYCRGDKAVSGSFTICGHGYCSKCMLQQVDNCASQGMYCGQCATPIHIKDIKSALSPQQFSKLCTDTLAEKILEKPSDFNIRPCPSNCNSLLPHLHQVQFCKGCDSHVCTDCDIVCAGPSHHHHGRSCADYKVVLEALERERIERERAAERERREQKEREEAALEEMKNVDLRMQTIVAKGKDFIRSNWTQDMAAIDRIDINPGVQVNTVCPAYTRFLSTITKGLASIENGFFAWHGSGEAAIAPICDTGFDPSKRSGQACGPGEYFGVTSSVSLGYCRGGRQMILAYIVRGPKLTERPGFCYVVNNPVDWSYSYCLPLCVVTFGVGRTATEPKFIVRRSLSSAGNPKRQNESVRLAYEAPFRWHWQEDNGKMFPYTDEINSMLEKFHDAWQLESGPLEVVTPPIIRFRDDTPQEYIINFSTNRQTNRSTRYQRNIARTKVNVPAGEGRWYFEEDSGEWSKYDSFIEGEIENAFLGYRRGCAPSKIIVNFPGRPENYELNFVTCRQKNCTSSTEREVKRVVSTSLISRAHLTCDRGFQILYHQTDVQGLEGIVKCGGKMRCSGASAGLLAGAGIYFAETPKLTLHKARRKGIILKAKVYTGNHKALSSAGDPTITLENLRSSGYDSVQIPRPFTSEDHPGGTEWVVYSDSQVTILEFTDDLEPFIALQGKDKRNIVSGVTWHSYNAAEAWIDESGVSASNCVIA